MEWIIAGTVFGAAFVLLALLLRVIPKSGDGEKPKDDKKTPDPAQPPAAPPTPPASAQPATGASRSGQGHGSPIGKAISWTVVLAFWAVLGLGGYWILTQINDGREQQLAEVSQPRAASAARTTSVRYDTDPRHYCTTRASDSVLYPVILGEWTEVKTKGDGYEFCSNPDKFAGRINFQCKVTADEQWGECGNVFRFIRFKSEQPVSVWWEPYRTL